MEMCREEGRIKVGLETNVTIVLPGIAANPRVSTVVKQYADELEQLFIVSGVDIVEGGKKDESVDSAAENVSPGGWKTVIQDYRLDNGEKITILVKKAKMEKCVRCWVYHAEKEGEVCRRCEEVVWEMVEGGEVKLEDQVD